LLLALHCWLLEITGDSCVSFQRQQGHGQAETPQSQVIGLKNASSNEIKQQEFMRSKREFLVTVA
jgi:hypothetical protein